MAFLYFVRSFFGEKRSGKMRTQKNYRITTGTNFAKDTGVSAKRWKLPIHYIQYCVRMSQAKGKNNPKASKPREQIERNGRKKRKYICNINHKMVEKS